MMMKNYKNIFKQKLLNLLNLKMKCLSESFYLKLTLDLKNGIASSQSNKKKYVKIARDLFYLTGGADYNY